MDPSIQNISVQKLEEELTCSVFFEPLATATSLIPCMHKVSQLAAEQMFGQTSDGWKVQPGKNCPLCRKAVIGYSADYTIRNIVTQIVGLSSEMLQQVQKRLREKIPDHSLKVEAPTFTPLPYPGESAVFKHTSGDLISFFDPIGSGPFCRGIEFKSLTENSSIDEFTLLGYSGNRIAIHIKFSNEELFAEYLRSHGLLIGSAQMYLGLFKADTKNDIQTLFAIIAKHNNIPDSHYSQLKKIVERGSYE